MNETEASVTAVLNAMIDRAMTLTDDDELAFGVILSRISRELRRSYGVEGAQRFLLEFVATLSSIQSDGDVVVPSGDYHMDEDERAIWLMTHVIIEHVRLTLGDDRQMFMIMLRCITNKMGDNAHSILIGFAETMAEAADYDV